MQTPRGIDLSTISQGSLAGIELYKALTADKDADAIAGSVNLVTKKAPSERVLRFDAKGAYNKLNNDDVKLFLLYLLRHLRGPIMLLWDRGTIHRHHSIQPFIDKHPRLHSEFFPAYAPELNPAEYIWNRADFALSNSVSNTQSHLHGRLHTITRRLRTSQKRLFSCIHASGLPWR